MIARGSWVLIPSGSAHDLTISLSCFMGNDCKGFLGPHTLGFCARPLLFLSLASWGMIARGSWVLVPSGSAHDPLSLFLGGCSLWCSLWRPLWRPLWQPLWRPSATSLVTFLAI